LPVRFPAGEVELFEPALAWKENEHADGERSRTAQDRDRNVRGMVVTLRLVPRVGRHPPMRIHWQEEICAVRARSVRVEGAVSRRARRPPAAGRAAAGWAKR